MGSPAGPGKGPRPGRLARTLATLLLPLGLAGCWTSAETGNDILRRVRSLEEGVERSRRDLRAEIERAQASVVELEAVLERATRLVTRNSADTGAEVETLRADLARLRGTLAELEHALEGHVRSQTETAQQVERLARRLGVDMALDPSQIPAGADAHFQAAERAFLNSELSLARALYRAFVERYADDGRADDAQYRIGASYLREERPATALGELRAVITRYRSGDRVGDALADMAEAFWQLHSCDDARTTAQALLRTDPRHPRARDGREILRRVASAPDGYCTS